MKKSWLMIDGMELRKRISPSPFLWNTDNGLKSKHITYVTPVDPKIVYFMESWTA